MTNQHQANEQGAMSDTAFSLVAICWMQNNRSMRPTQFKLVDVPAI